MARSNVRGCLVLLVLLTVCVSAIPLTNPVPFLNNATISRFASQNVTSPSPSSNPLDYRIIGTNLILRITETGDLFTEAATNRIIDHAISEVVTIINKGSGRDFLRLNRFGDMTGDIELRIQSIPDKGFTYFVLGKRTPCRRLLLIGLSIISRTRALREWFVIVTAARLRFRGPWTKY